MTDRRYVNIPPDSSGKRVLLRGAYDIPYTNKINGGFKIGQTINCLATSNQTFSGRIIKVTEDSLTTGFITLMLSQPTIDNQSTPIPGTSITDKNGVIYATVQNQGNDLFANANVLVSHDNMTKGQLVDSQGAAHIRFSEGAPQLDGFGRLRTSEQTTLGDYNFTFNRQSLLFSELKTGGGTISHSTTTGAVELATDGQLGSETIFQSNLYHFYKTGTSQVTRMSVATSTLAKQGVVYRWGYFDENDGVYFQLDEQGLSIVTRSSTSGVVEELIVRQSEWNNDRADGSRDELNRSFVNIDPTKVNMYWIDGQWLGRIRAGIEGPNGRVVLHELFESNRYPLSQSRRASLPVRFEVSNVGVSGSSSEMRVWNANVHEESTLNFDEVSIPMHSSSNSVVVNSNNTFLIALRSEDTYFGIKNTIAAVFKTMAVRSFDNLGNPVPVTIQAYYVISPVGAVGGGAWVNADNGSLVPGYNISSVEVNKTGAFAPVGISIGEYFVNGSDNAIDVSDMTVYQKAPLIRREDGFKSEIVFVASKVSTGSSDPEVKISLHWRELG